jgi:hypothetical protein
MTSALYVLFYSILDAVLAATIAIAIGGNEKLELFLFTVAALWLLPPVLGLWNLIKFWLGYFLFARRKMTRLYRSEFHRTKFPSASPFFDWDSYLAGIINGDTAPQTAKLKASFIAGELAGFRATRAFTWGIAAQKSLDDAMESYSPDRVQNELALRRNERE